MGLFACHITQISCQIYNKESLKFVLYCVLKSDNENSLWTENLTSHIFVCDQGNLYPMGYSILYHHMLVFLLEVYPAKFAFANVFNFVPTLRDIIRTTIKPIVNAVRKSHPGITSNPHPSIIFRISLNVKPKSV